MGAGEPWGRADSRERWLVSRERWGEGEVRKNETVKEEDEPRMQREKLGEREEEGEGRLVTMVVLGNAVVGTEEGEKDSAIINL